ncbi:MAG: c-type cytochrome, partial [Flavobacteriales bacterium]
MSLVARLSERSTGLLHATLALFLSFSITVAQAQPADAALYSKGEKLFKGNCGSCHKPLEKLTGPPLKGAKAKWEGKGDIHAWVHNSQTYLKTGNEMATAIWEQFKPTLMTPVAVTDEEIDAILYYADNYTPPVKSGPPPPTPGAEPASGDNWPWLIVLALLFAVVAISMGSVKRDLNNAVREVEGQAPEQDPGFWGRIRGWAWEHKVFVSFIGLFIFVWINVKLWDAAFWIGVYGGPEVEHYKPEQPILFNHTLHAGKADKGNLAINCQYCHSGAEKS